MLKSIFIKNFALIDELSIDFDDKLNIITGETGAGKSIIIDAIDAVLGARGSKDYIKEGEEKAIIELILTSNNPKIAEFLEQNGIDNLEEIIFSREITPQSSRSRINGTLVTQNILQELKNFLIDIHSQHQTYKYLQPKTHIYLLDNYGDDEHLSLIEKYQKLYKELLSTKRTLKEKSAQNQGIEKRLDFLKFQIEEIEKAEIEDVDEFEKLKMEREKIINAKELKDISYNSYYALYAQDGSIISTLSSIENKLIKAGRIDETLSKMADNIAESSALLEDVASELRNYAENLSMDEYRLEILEDRISLLEKLRRKYGNTLTEILQQLEFFQKEYEEIEHADENLKELEEKISNLEKQTDNLAKNLTEKRMILAEKLENLIENELHFLSMPKAQFKILVEKKEKDYLGMDEIEFLISANAGESPKPLAKIASGGEIARVMLAIKSIFAKSDNLNTVIFDEIETGISGKALQCVADKMEDLAGSHQIICITHQPIIAAKADKHLHVEKYQDVSTHVDIKTLDLDEKIEILAQIAGGTSSEEGMAFVKNLLANKKLR